MSKPQRPNLAALRQSAGSVHTTERLEAMPVPAAMTEMRKAPAATRVGTKPVTGHFPAGVRAQLKMLAAEKERTMEDLLGEALNDLFAKYNKPELVPVKGRGGAA